MKMQPVRNLKSLKVAPVPNVRHLWSLSRGNTASLLAVVATQTAGILNHWKSQKIQAYNALNAKRATYSSVNLEMEKYSTPARNIRNAVMQSGTHQSMKPAPSVVGQF